MRKFELISEKQWENDITDNFGDNSCDRKDHLKPFRGTKNSAGYDFISPVEIVLRAHSMGKIPTGIKVSMEEDDVLSIYPRSSLGFKTGMRLANTVGIVDSDYYDNEDNEGHIFVKIYNHTDNDYVINIGDKFAQGVFSKFLTVDDEEEIETERTGGIGSTGV